MYVLGIGCYYHDASAALLKDGAIVVAAEEERFKRITGRDQGGERRCSEWGGYISEFAAEDG